MIYELSIVGDKYFKESTFNGEEFVFDYDTDDEATLLETFESAFNIIGFNFKNLDENTKQQMLEDTYFDIEHNDTCFNININEK